MKRSAQRAAATAALAVAAVSCDVLLDIPGESEPLDAGAIRTCACDLLVTQGSGFTERCERELDAIFAADPSSDPAALEAQLELGELNCKSCTEVEPCYASIVGAGTAGDACVVSEDCGSWACCVEVALAITLPERDVTVVAQEAPRCCQPTPPDVSCEPCEAVIEAYVAGEELPVTCGEALLALRDLAACFRDLGPLEDGCPCALGTTGACVACLWQNAKNGLYCRDEATVCEAGAPRPVYPQEG